ncbi:hypothetical protein SSPO_071160 [Streptomyces antimycoticus]|uniref:Uncharacterized protein n=1 Tax=Streptomyces antimycoticus TaxID=68175 RepID=A0A499UWH3_9ACTN|nr:hypothetical protein SSPO_071160 [Streptomyces antimycoticus]
MADSTGCRGGPEPAHPGAGTRGGAQPSSVATYFRHSAVNSVRLTPSTFRSADSTAPERSDARPTVR